MTPFSLFAPAKVNLALHVLGRRADGYHELDSIVAFADIGDRLTFSKATDFSIIADGPFAGGLPEPTVNMIAKTWAAISELAMRRGKALPIVQVHLEKNLPVASGIGGGSANAAAAMRGFLKIAGIDSIDDEILAVALRLGADVPVCLRGKACRMQGIGERIEPLEGFKPLHAVLVNPKVEVPTANVFRQLGLKRGQRFGLPIGDVSSPESWRNDLAASAIALAPVIGEVVGVLEKFSGVIRVSMSGSGATCVALLDLEEAMAKSIDRFRQAKPDWWVQQAKLA